MAKVTNHVLNSSEWSLVIESSIFHVCLSVFKRYPYPQTPETQKTNQLKRCFMLNNIQLDLVYDRPNTPGNETCVLEEE